MTVTDVVKDTENRRMTITAEFGAPVERVWQIWADPRQLERWWGPPTYPATVVDHDLSPGGAVNYFMTSPEGDKHAGWWRLSAAVPTATAAAPAWRSPRRSRPSRRWNSSSPWAWTRG